MSTVWVSTTGLVLRDLVPTPLRRHWVDQGHCPDQDLYTLLRAHAHARPRQAALVDPQGELTYRDLAARVAAAAAALAGRGLGPGDLIAVALPGGREAVLAELAVAAIGAVALPYPTRCGRRTTLHLLARSRASAVLTRPGTAAWLHELRAELPFLRANVDIADVTAAPERPDRPGRWRAPRIDPESPARVLVSSGTEAAPKMVAYSHNAMAGGRANYVAALHDGPEPMRNLVLVPLSSSMGSLGTSVTLAALGATLLLPDTSGGFDPAAALRMVRRWRPTHLFGVPTMLRRMADRPPEPGEDLSSLRAVVSSGAPLPPDAAPALARRFGTGVINVYGSADGVNCHTARARGPDAGAGRPDPRVAEIRVVGDDGRDAPAGSGGEIWARGPMTPLCYVGAPELDARYRTPDGWVRTGDRGLLDAAGRLHVTGRLKQVVIRGGHNISPAEVESAIAAHPEVAEAVCVPAPDPDLGERLCACVVQRPGTRALTLPEINAFLVDARGLERPKLPELLVTLPELPLGATGKACRQTLMRYAADACPAPNRSDTTSPGTRDRS